MHGQVSQMTAVKDTFWSDEYYKYSKMKSGNGMNILVTHTYTDVI